MTFDRLRPHFFLFQFRVQIHDRFRFIKIPRKHEDKTKPPMMSKP